MKLFCFPHAGGFATYYDFMKKHKFKNIQETVIYEYPGRGLNCSKTNDKDMNERVERATKQIYEIGVENNEYIIFGHSMGSFVGYETARLLSKRYNAAPALVIMSGQNPPCVFDDIKGSFDTNVIDLDEFLGKLGGVPDFLKNCPSALTFYKSFIESDMELLNGYGGCTPQKEERLPLGTVVFGEKDPIVFRRTFTRWKENFSDLIPQKIFEGGHFYMENKQEELCNYIDNMALKTHGLRR